MSRSIHQNKSRRYWRQHGDHGEEDWVAQFRKSEIKRFIRTDRESPDLPFSPVAPDAIRYSIDEVHPSLFFPATLDDVKGVMDELPPGFLNGVSSVRFLDGEAYINDLEYVEGQVFDPTLKRKSIEIEPGIYAPIVLGTYNKRLGEIKVFAYAMDQSVQITDATVMRLKMHMLLTLVHELAHNKDSVQRVARGRWRGDDTDKAEAYAYKLERVLFDSVVIPFVRRLYREQTLDFPGFRRDE